MRTLIVNPGNLGDITRTTALFNVLGGELHILSRRFAQSILRSPRVSRVYAIEDACDSLHLADVEFDLLVSYHEDQRAMLMCQQVNAKRVVGSYITPSGQVGYSSCSSELFDMSLISKLPSNEADLLKRRNQKSIPQLLIEMVGCPWEEQRYDIGLQQPETIRTTPKIGIATQVKCHWPNKGWTHYHQLGRKLTADGFEVTFLPFRQHIEQHIADVADCNLIISGDTFSMHLAIALRRKAIALFNCTSPNEIFGYGGLTKIISPLLTKFYYSRGYSPAAVSAITVDEVYNAAIVRLTNHVYGLS